MFQLFASFRLGFFSSFCCLHYVDAVPSSGDSFSFQHSCWPALLHFPPSRRFHEDFQVCGGLHLPSWFVIFFFCYWPRSRLFSLFCCSRTEFDNWGAAFSFQVKRYLWDIALPFLLLHFSLYRLHLAVTRTSCFGQCRSSFVLFLLYSFFCSSVAAATSLLEYTLGLFAFSGIIVIVWADSLTTFPLFVLNVPSSFELRDRSLTRIDESSSS